MKIKGLILETIVLLAVITCLVMAVNTFQIRRGATGYANKLQEQYLDATFDIYKDEIIGDILVGDDQITKSLFKEISERRSIGLKIMHKNSVQTFGNVLAGMFSKEYKLDFGSGDQATLGLYFTESLGKPRLIEDLKTSLFVEMLVLGLGFVYLLWRFNRKLLAPLSNLVAHLKPEDQGSYDVQPDAIQEIRELGKTLKDHNHQIKENAIFEAEIGAAKQIAHDIRSPLMVIDVITRDLSEISEEKRVTIKSAVNMLKDLANNMLATAMQKGRESAQDHAEPVSILLERIISEKRVQLSREIDIDMGSENEVFGLFAKIDNMSFKRIMSNVINNAVDAIRGRTLAGEELCRGRIQIFVKPYQEGGRNKINVEIHDNGCGIASENLGKILEGGVSIGKKGGSGIGLSSAKQLLDKYGGGLDIKSRVNVGTVVTLTILVASAASWFLEKLIVGQKSDVLILDDDEMIHGIWEKRFKETLGSGDEITLNHFYTADKFIEYSRKNRAKSVVCLVDYELAKGGATGLDVIKKLNLEDCSILVTSRYEDYDLRKESSRFGIKILPKNFAPYIPIEITLSSVQGAIPD